MLQIAPFVTRVGLTKSFTGLKALGTRRRELQRGSCSQSRMSQPMIDRPPVRCSLKIDGCGLSAVIAPYVCNYGFWLSDDDPWARAHFRLGLTPETLSEVLRRQPGRPVEVDGDLGPFSHVDENRGYSAADLGPCRRPVTALRLRLSHREGATTFGFEGTTGPIDPQTVFGAARPTDRVGWRFEVEFTIADADLHRYFVDEVALRAVQTYAKSWGGRNGAG
jgi:hypothetical protein